MLNQQPYHVREMTAKLLHYGDADDRGGLTKALKIIHGYHYFKNNA
jgi:hypothetical protein